MDRGHYSAPVSGRTRLQMNSSYRKEYSQSSRRRDVNVMNRKGSKPSSRTPEAKFDARKLTPNPVREVEFLLVDRDGTVRKKFYFDEMEISLDSKDKGKETIQEGTTSVQPIVLSDDDDDEEQVEPKDSSPANKQGSKESMPLKKRQKFDEQELPALPINSTLKGLVDAQSCPDMKGDKLFKSMKGDKLFKSMKGDKLFKDMKGDKLFKGMNSTAFKPKEIQAENPLGRCVKKEMMEAKLLG